MKNFGYTQNESAFEQIAQQTNIKIFAQNKHHQLHIYALLFGQAGLLSQNFKDDFPNHLKNEYAFLSKKYSLHPIAIPIKFGKIRPSNFPTIRLAQMASLIYHSKHLFSKIIECQKIHDLFPLFDASIHEYFHQHYTFDKLSPTSIPKKIGLQFIYSILINTVIPLVFIYAKINQQPLLAEKALHWLDNIPLEKNTIIQKWTTLHIKPANASQSQALIHLYKNYCTQKKCLQCQIGFHLLSHPQIT